MKKKINLLFCFCIFVCGTLLTGCSSDLEDSNSRSEKTNKLRSQILELADDYDLNLSIDDNTLFNNIDNIISFAIGRLLRDVISQDLSKPMRRYDSELEYIPTQFICEFIRVITGADGIQFNSSLDQDGVNVVLFNPKDINCIGVELHQVEKIAIKSVVII